MRRVLELPEKVVCAWAPCSLSLRLVSLVVLLSSLVGPCSEGSPSILLHSPARTEYRIPLHFPACPEYSTRPRFGVHAPLILRYSLCTAVWFRLTGGTLVGYCCAPHPSRCGCIISWRCCILSLGGGSKGLPRYCCTLLLVLRTGYILLSRSY